MRLYAVWYTTCAQYISVVNTMCLVRKCDKRTATKGIEAFGREKSWCVLFFNKRRECQVKNQNAVVCYSTYFPNILWLWIALFLLSKLVSTSLAGLWAGQKVTRKRAIPATFDDLASLAEYLLSFMAPVKWRHPLEAPIHVLYSWYLGLVFGFQLGSQWV